MVKVVNGSGSSLNGDVNNSKIKLRGPPPFDNGTVTCMHVMRRVGLATLQCKVGVAAAMLNKIQFSKASERL